MGEVVFAGQAAWSMVGKSQKTGDFDGVEDQILWGYHRLKPMIGIKISKIIGGPASSTCIALGADGTCYTWGKNNKGQLGHGHTTNIYNPMPVNIPGNETIIGGACGPNHTLLFSDKGSLFACGQGKQGQLGNGKKFDCVKNFSAINFSQTIVSVACGRDFSMIVDSTGSLYSFGHPEYGCLGNGSELKTLERANKFTYESITSPQLVVAMKVKYPTASIKDVACGVNHTVAMDTEGRIYTWGFGAYGRLGHNDNKDQYEPVAVELFSMEPPPPNPNLPKFMQSTQPKIRATQITCGNASSFVVAGEPFNSLYMFGITKRSGEATMAPQMVDQVQGWRVRSISSGFSSIAVASERTLISWGPSPTYGELGYGDNGKKSSTVSAEVQDMKGCMTLQVAMGTAHCLALVEVDEVGKTKLDKLPVFAPAEVDAQYAAAAAEEAVAANKTKRAAKKKEQAEADDDDDEESEEAGGEDSNEDAEESEEEEVKPKRKRGKKK